MSGRLCRTCGASLEGMDSRRRFCSDRCRKRQYDLACADCGGRVSGTDPGKLSDTPRCAGCWHAHQRASMYWTPERIIAAIHDWAERYGEPPTSEEWNPWLGHASDEQLERFRAARWPRTFTVQTRFGSWNAAIRAAGFEPRGNGMRRHRPRTAA